MHIRDIKTRLDAVKRQALEELDIPEDTIEQIGIETPPDPAMGDRGFACFKLAPHLRKSPADIAQEVADALAEHVLEDAFIARVRPVGPYVNVTFAAAEIARIVVGDALDADRFGADTAADNQQWMIEYSAPNTNKPQHLGHVRNDLLGESVARIGGWAGHRVTRVNLINDRGIHICKSMLAYQRFGDGQTPQQAGVKGDHFVGRYYVMFNTKLAQEYTAWLDTDAADARFVEWQNQRPDDADHPDELRSRFAEAYKNDYFNRDSQLGRAAKDMLRKWEAGDPEVVDLWETMNAWVFAGFDQTYARLGVNFDRVYRESQTYQHGKDIVSQGIDDAKFDRLDDGAVVCDLEALGLDGQKVLLRNDGTSVYMTQDIATAVARFRDNPIDQMIYVVGDEQDYHFQVLFAILERLDPALAGRLHHLSYGMVELPDGKMKSREGKIVDADDLMDEMRALADEAVRARWPDLDDADVDRRAEAIGMAALKYYILDFNPRTTVHFNPRESIEFQGRTGPYCLYSYARIQSIGQRMGGWPERDNAGRSRSLEALGTGPEMAIVAQLQQWPEVTSAAASDRDPSKITEYLFELCKSFSRLYNDDDHKIVDIDDPDRRDGLMYLSRAVARTLDAGLALLGIETLDEM